MTSFAVRPAGSTFRRIGGREGFWHIHARRRSADFPLDPDDDVVCPFDFVEVPGSRAEAAIDDLKRQIPESTPILFGSPHEAGIMLERRRARAKTPEDWLRDTERFELSSWFAERAAKWREWEAESLSPVPPRGPWPRTAETYTKLTVPHEILVSGYKPTVIIGLLPTCDPTETAAYLGFGGWNDCPVPPVHVLLARRWHERYGAVQVCNTYETVEFRVAKPIINRDEALRLALDQFSWCSDSVPVSLEVAAAELIGSSVWVFWWD